MRFLCDMGVSRKVSEWLCGQGYEASHLGEEGLARLPNGKIFSKAIAENRVILTFDLDFGEIAALSGGRVASVVGVPSPEHSRRPRDSTDVDGIG